MGAMEDVIRLMLSIENKRNQNAKTPSSSGGGNSSNTNVDSNFELGVISEVMANGMLVIVINGVPKVMAPTTDEEFKLGQKVWTVKTIEGEYIAIGGARK